VASDDAKVTVINSSLQLYDVKGEAVVYISESYLLQGSSIKSEDGANIWIINSKVTGGKSMRFADESCARIIDSSVYVISIDMADTSCLWLINSTVSFSKGSSTNYFFESNRSKIIYSSYLNIIAYSPSGKPLEDALVEVYYSNSSLVESATTDSSGNAQLNLMRHIQQNGTDLYFVTNRVKVTSAGFEAEASLDFDLSKQVIIIANPISTPAASTQQPSSLTPIMSAPTVSPIPSFSLSPIASPSPMPSSPALTEQLTVEPTLTPKTGHDSNYPLPLIIGIVVILLVAAVVGMLVYHKKRAEQ
jgi:LPXTG-motif cell wall-anchored protein